VNYLLFYHAREYLHRGNIQLTLVYKEPSFPESDLLSATADGEKMTITLFQAYKGALYAFIYRQTGFRELTGNALTGAFLKLSRDLKGEVLNFNALLFRMTQAHALNWLALVPPGNNSFLKALNAEDTDYVEIWKLGDLKHPGNGLSGYTIGNDIQTVILDMGYVHSLNGFSITLNDSIDRNYLIQIIKVYLSNNGIAWTERDIYILGTADSADPQRISFRTALSTRYLKLVVDTGTVAGFDGIPGYYASG
jgi:hypothetical protein